jgi:hypothetical protein
MQFTYTYLKNAEMNGVTVGHYKGYDVIPTTKERLARNGERYDYIYLIYDDNNLLYRDGKVFGGVDKNGNVTEFMARRYLVHYEARREEIKEIPRAETPQEAPAAETTTDTSNNSASGIMTDVVLEALVEGTLANARTMSIDELLKDFNYGLE